MQNYGEQLFGSDTFVEKGPANAWNRVFSAQGVDMEGKIGIEHDLLPNFGLGEGQVPLFESIRTAIHHYRLSSRFRVIRQHLSLIYFLYIFITSSYIIIITIF